MPNFLSLSDAIKYQINKHDNDTKIKIPAYYDSSGLFGKQNIPMMDGQPDENVIRWGYSIWGEEKVTAEYKPEDKK
jgi:hypothetical protein